MDWHKDAISERYWAYLVIGAFLLGWASGGLWAPGAWVAGFVVGGRYIERDARYRRG